MIEQLIFNIRCIVTSLYLQRNLKNCSDCRIKSIIECVLSYISHHETCHYQLLAWSREIWDYVLLLKYVFFYFALGKLYRTQKKYTQLYPLINTEISKHTYPDSNQINDISHDISQDFTKMPAHKIVFYFLR